MSRERQLAALYTHSVFIGIKQQCGSAEAVTSMDTLRNYSIHWPVINNDTD